MDEAPGRGVLYITSLSSSMAARGERKGKGGLGMLVGRTSVVCVREDSLKEIIDFFFWERTCYRQNHHAVASCIHRHGCSPLGNSTSMFTV
jgi:hypothetical protein